MKAVIKRVLRDFLNQALYRPLPRPGPSELRLLGELRAAFDALPAVSGSDPTRSDPGWAANMIRLREQVLTRNPRHFLRWTLLHETMFAGYGLFVRKELAYLRRCADWATRWRPALREHWAGNPVPYPFYPRSSGNLIHQAYHLARFEEATGRPIRDWGRILEFGGGYGSMARLCRNLAATAEYLIFDLPPFSALQRYYLGTCGLPVIGDGDPGPGIRLVSDWDVLQALLARSAAEPSLLIANWSLSEAPVALRWTLASMIGNFSGQLLAYQWRWGNGDNRAFFEAWRRHHDALHWNSSDIPHLPGNSYLFGARPAGVHSRSTVLPH